MPKGRPKKQAKPEYLYVVEAYTVQYAYVVGVFTSKDLARKALKRHIETFTAPYSGAITEIKPDQDIGNQESYKSLVDTKL